MKKSLLLLFTVASFAAVQAQICVSDSTILLNDTLIVTPQPYSNNYQVYALAHACIGQPYLQSFTLNIPDTLMLTGVPIPLQITNFSIATTGALSNLPTGITYLCEPPNCVFPANSLGCILLYGTPTANNVADTFSLSFTIYIQSLLFPFPVPFTFPEAVLPGSTYFLILDPAGNCVSSAYDLHSQILGIKNMPNPFGQQTIIEVQAATTSNFQFEVYDLLGQSMHRQNVHLFEGINQFTFDAGALPDGTYFYSLSNQEGKVTKVMVIAR